MSLELTQNAKNLLADARASTRCSVPGRCVARSSARSRTSWPRRCCTARSVPVRSCWSTSTGEGPTAEFTFVGQKVGEVPDLPPLETVAVEPPSGPSGRGEGEDETPGPTDVEKAAGTD